MREHQRLFIGGEWVEPAGSGTIDVISPHSEELVGRVPEGTAADIDRAVAAARDAFDNGEWPRLSPEERMAAVQKFSEVYAAHIPDMAAGIPKGVVSVIPAGREVGEHLVRHPDVDKIAFTGSTAAGRRIASICGEQLKRVSLELGGKSAAIILDDADLAATVEGLKFASLMNNGQACVAQTRILASRDRYDEVVDAVSGMVGGLAVGDPENEATEVGPLVAERQQERVEKYIAVGQEEGAKVAVGGNGRPSGLEKGWYVKPTVFSGVDNSMRIAREEIFGPVLAVIPYDDADDAVRIANDSEYGLAGSVWTGDVDQGLDIARRVRTGTYGVNQYTMDFIAPFGGYKGSGLGREFGVEGLSHYVELKSIVPPAGA